MRRFDWWTIGAALVAFAGAMAAMQMSRGRDLQRPPSSPPPSLIAAAESLGVFSSRGSPTATDTLIEISDPFCPACAQAVAKLHAPLTNRVEAGELVHRVLDLPFRPGADVPIAAANCALRQGENDYWTYRTTLYAAQASVMASFPVEDQLVRIGLFSLTDTSKLRECLRTRRPSDGDVFDLLTAAARADGLSFTPAYYLNGRFTEVAKLFELYSPSAVR